MEIKTILRKIWSVLKYIWAALKHIWAVIWSFIRHPIWYVKTLVPRLKQAGWLQRILLLAAPIVGSILIIYAVQIVFIVWLGMAFCDPGDPQWRQEVIDTFILRHDREPESFDEALRG